MRITKKICVLFLLLNTCFISFAQNISLDSLVVRVELDDSKLNKNEQSYVDSAFDVFIENLTLYSSIRVKTDKIDETSRELQTESLVNAYTGHGTEDNTYEIDRSSMAKLLLLLNVKKINGEYQLSCSISHIEKSEIIGKVLSNKVIINDLASKGINNLSYKTLNNLVKNGFIKELTYDAISQLQHEDNTALNVQNYINTLNKQSEDTRKELEKLLKSNASEAQKIENENEALALQLKLEMLEKKKTLQEEQLKIKQQEDGINRRREVELDAMNKKQKDEFLNAIKDLNSMTEEIRNKTIEELQFDKRIELIETDKKRLVGLHSDLNTLVLQGNQAYESQMNSEIEELNSSPWRNAETDANDNPTEIAIKNRENKKTIIEEKYRKLQFKMENELRISFRPELKKYSLKIENSIKELEDKEFIIRSIDKYNNFLTINVAKFDGEKYSWEIESNFRIPTMKKLKISNVILPNTEITYKMMTGKKPDKNQGDEYLNTTDLMDLYFRTSVPYIFSELKLKIKYDTENDIYIPSIKSFNIYKTEKSKKPLIRITAGDIKKIEADRVREEKKALAEVEKAKAKVRFENNQTGRGNVFNISFADINGVLGNGYFVDVRFLGGKKHFYGGIGGSLSVFMSDYSILDISAIVGSVVNFEVVPGVILAPYLDLGVGVGMFGANDANTTVLIGTTVLTSGFEVNLQDSLSIGAYYKLMYASVGFMDCYGISFSIF